MNKPRRIRKDFMMRADHVEQLQSIADRRGATIPDLVREALIAYWNLPIGQPEDEDAPLATQYAARS